MTKPRILCVDDSEMIRRFLEQYFAVHYRVQTFESGIQAWEWLDTGNFPDLILLDLVMPEIDGYQFLQQLKGSVTFQDVPVIILSGIDTSNRRIACLQAGAADYVIKPFNPEELECRINFHLRSNMERA